MLKHPASIYINWAAYDELSDTVELTEEIAMRQLRELLRLRKLGVKFDAYLMDCFWFAEDGGYRTWRKPHWPDGPDRWLDCCRENGVIPGLWFSTNCIVHPNPERRLRPVPEWMDSLDGTPAQWWGMCLFYGGYLPHLMQTLHQWYERGVRVFKFDFMCLDFAPPHLKAAMLPSQIRSANTAAIQGALSAFKQAHPDAVFLAYNGFDEGSQMMNNTGAPLRKVVDGRWLESFDALYCGDPRPADIPVMNFWRAKDIYSDHMVFAYQFNGIPLQRIDNSSFMIGTTGTCYRRGLAAWKGMLLLSLARGGWANTYYGNLDLLDEENAAWFAKAQRLFYPLQATAPFSTLGALPGTGRPYGYSALAENGGVITVVNPSQEVASLTVSLGDKARLLFRDAGFQPILGPDTVTLGPEQMAVIGVGAYASPDFDLGIQEDVPIPLSIRRLDAEVLQEGSHAITATLAAPSRSTVRIILRQTDPNGFPKRSTGGAALKEAPMDQVLKIEASQAGAKVPVINNYGRVIWSGLSWAVGEIAGTEIKAGVPLTVRCSTTESNIIRLTCELHEVVYEKPC
jgi:hypothetical protein